VETRKCLIRLYFFPEEKIHSHVCIYCARNGLIFMWSGSTPVRLPGNPRADGAHSCNGAALHEVKSRQYLEFGWPTDLLSHRSTKVGTLTYRTAVSAFRARSIAAHGSIWRPLGQAIRDLDVTVVYQARVRMIRQRPMVAGRHPCRHPP